MTNHEENQLIALDKNAENDLVNLLKSKVITVHCNAALAIKAMVIIIYMKNDVYRSHKDKDNVVCVNY